MVNLFLKDTKHATIGNACFLYHLDYVTELLEEVLQLRDDTPSLKRARSAETSDIPSAVCSSYTSYGQKSKQEVVQSVMSRFNTS